MIVFSIFYQSPKNKSFRNIRKVVHEIMLYRYQVLCGPRLKNLDKILDEIVPAF